MSLHGWISRLFCKLYYVMIVSLCVFHSKVSFIRGRKFVEFGECQVFQEAIPYRAMSEAIHRRCVTAEARVQFHACPRRIYGAQSDIWTVLSSSTLFSPLSVSLTFKNCASYI